jgi:hypothetical protein
VPLASSVVYFGGAASRSAMRVSTLSKPAFYIMEAMSLSE